MKLIAIEELQHFQGIPFPEEPKFRQFLVTGPPGTGKSTLITRIKGWPEEGYIDVGIQGWWKAQTLTFRPREIHLGIPFVGAEESYTVFEEEWLDADPPLEIDYPRIFIPPAKKGWWSSDWRQRYVFEFLTPPAKDVFEWRQSRQEKGTHHVDRNLTLEVVERQREAYLALALYFHRRGMLVYVREGIDATPLWIDEPVDDDA